MTTATPFRRIANGGKSISDTAEWAYRAWERDDIEILLGYLNDVVNDCRTIQRMAQETIAHIEADPTNPDGCPTQMVETA